MRLICGDALREMQRMDDGVFDAIRDRIEAA